MKKTHRVVKTAEIPVQYLADYMASSNQVRRGIVQKSKYKSLARVFQHQIARKTISDHILEGNPLPGDLKEKAEDIRNLLADSDFDTQLHNYNAEFVEAFADVSDKLDLSWFQLQAPQKPEHPSYNGTTVKFTPSLLTYRKTKANTHKIGGIMYRYAKASPVPKEAAEFQAAFMYGFFTTNPFVEEAKPEDALCVVFDAVNGMTYNSPAKAIYKFNEMKAVCGDIAEKWDNIPPPAGAVL
ncbi:MULTISPECIES: hypothetical protein [unclassified Mesorhizobium]|uniref:hypothetical protein n=1 Tax=unclassified Mesorhizobium TaxID=325217 RepID=UPI002414F5BB|nr:MULTISPECIES: hypothetical protein [unclassified Mesorhizobium]MDG4852982.1 hypothetical protein [Mesorhizobium sp. WSM4982]MDG4912950.1 hypothetical protein [Mesorhizobium sp. WSM4983]